MLKQARLAYRRDHKPPLVARAHCVFADGQTRRLYITRLDERGASIVSLMPPPVGSELELTIFPAGCDETKAISARVISQTIDPTDAALSGFDVVFIDLPPCTRACIERTRQIVGGPPKRLPERRVQPRIETDLKALLDLGHATITTRMLNISLSGALLAFSAPIPARLAPGQQVPLTIISTTAPERITLRCEIVRHTGSGEPRGLGVRFFDVQGATLRRIEGLILDTVLSHGRNTA
jgi:hypothetical protein